MSENKVNSIFTRIMAVFLAAVMLFSDIAMCKTYAAGESDDLVPISGEEAAAMLGGDEALNVDFSPEAEAAFTQTMTEIVRLAEAGQLAYSETTGMLTITDPNADLSGLGISDIETVTDSDGTTRYVASVGSVDGQGGVGPVVIGEALSAGGASVADEEPTEEPTEEEPAEEPAEEEPAEEPAEEEPAEEPVEEEPTEEPAEEEPAEEPVEEEPAEEPTEEEPAEEAGDEALDEEAELQGLFDCCDRKETKTKNVPYYNTYKDGRKKKGTVSAKNTIVEVIDSKRTAIWPFGSVYYKVKIPGVGTYWIHSDNLKDHECSAAAAKSETKYSPISGNNDKHNKTTTTEARVCKCGCVVAKYKKDTKKEDHNWNDLGVCTSCGYDFKESKDNVSDKIYMVNGDGVALHSAPYGAAPTTRVLNSTDSVKVTHETKNAFHSFWSPHVWYLTDAGDWIYSDNAKSHKHSYNDESSKTGKCTVCKRMYGYDIISESDTAYEVEVSYNVPIRKYPYSKADVVAYTEAGTIYTVNGHTYPDPNAGFWSKGDKWYRLKGLGWVKYSDIKQHVTHKYNQDSGGFGMILGVDFGDSRTGYATSDALGFSPKSYQ